MARNFSMTNDSVPVVEIVEPLTLIRQDLRIKESALTESISEFLEFIMKQEVYDHSLHDYDEKTCPICLKFSIPYCLRSENRSEYKPLLQTIEKALTYSITTAKRIRQELYSTPNEEVKYDMPVSSKLPTNEIPDQSKLKQALGMKKTVQFDPHSPMAKMEELVQGLTEILFIFKRWLKWFEGLILEGLMFNTPTSLQSELNQLIEIFGTDIEPNIWIAFQFHKDLREQDAERHAVSVATALQKQEDRERNDMSNMMPNPSG